MDIQSNEILNASKIKNKKIHIIGCGATGSHLAIELVKLGCERLILWDFDIVESHNLTNQIWNINDIGKLKNVALLNHILAINPEIESKITLKAKWTPDEPLLTDIVFNCVDSIELRKQIYEVNKYNKLLQYMLDPRLGSTTGSVFCYKWNDENIKKLIALTNFKDDEMDVERSLCGTKININTTLYMVVNMLLNNFVNIINQQPYFQQIYFEPLKYKITFYEEVNKC